MSKLDKKGRPVSMLSQYERKEFIQNLLGVWEANPRWSFGRLIDSVSRIHAGTTVTLNMVEDRDMAVGVSALVPDDWEVEERKAHPATPVRL